MSNFLSITNERGHFGYPSLSQDLEWKPHVEMALTYQVLTKQCLKKVFPTSNDFVSNGSSLLNSNSQHTQHVIKATSKTFLFIFNTHLELNDFHDILMLQVSREYI